MTQAIFTTPRPRYLSFTTLYVATASGKTYARQRHIQGYAPSSPPIKLPAGSAG